MGPTLRRWRLAKGLRQEDVESSTGINQAYLSDLERGNIKEPGFRRVAIICEALGHSMLELLSEDDNAARRQLAAA